MSAYKENSTSKYAIYRDYATIPEFPDYWINANGRVLDMRTQEPAIQLDNDRVVLDGCIRNISTLLVLAYIGNLPFPIIPAPDYDSANRTRYRNSRYTYKVPIRVGIDAKGSIFFGNVEFRAIPFTNRRYAISSNGVIFDFLKQRYVRRYWSGGYAYVTLAMLDANGKMHANRLGVARAIYLAWIDPDLDPSFEVDHKNNRRWDNRAENLQALTRVDNTRKSRFEGARNTPYTLDQIEHIFQMMAENKSHAEIAEYLGLPYTTRSEKHHLNAQLFKMRKQPGYYDDFKAKYDVSHYDNDVNYTYRHLTAAEVDEIKRRLAAGEKGNALAKEYGVTPATISRVNTSSRLGTRTK